MAKCSIGMFYLILFSMAGSDFHNEFINNTKIQPIYLNIDYDNATLCITWEKVREKYVKPRKIIIWIPVLSSHTKITYNVGHYSCNHHISEVIKETYIHYLYGYST